MNTIYTRRPLSLATIVLSVFIAGCASVAVTENSLEKNTAAALRIDQGSFTISNRQDDGVKTDYLVTTNSNKKYSCYVTGTVSLMGRVVSDAICTEVGKTAKQSSTKNSSCDALSKAAGKCS